MFVETASDNDKTLLRLSCLIASFFAFLFLNSTFFEFKVLLISVVQEIVTIPLMIGQVILLVITVKRLSANFSWLSLNFYSAVVLTVSTLLTWGSLLLT